MNTTQAQTAERPAREESQKRVSGSWILEAVGALAAIVLAALGLAEILPYMMAAVATIVIGAAFLVEGGAVESHYRRYISKAGINFHAPELNEGVRAEFMGGLAGVVLGILALFGTSAETLMAVAVLVFGATLMLGSAILSRLPWLAVFKVSAEEPAKEAAPLAFSGQLFVGLAAMVLGILAILGMNPLTLILVALLCLGAAALFGSSAVRARMTFLAEK